MGLIHSIKNYKFAKATVKDLQEVLLILDTTLEKLKSHSKYQYVSTTIQDIKERRNLVKNLLEHQKLILKTKGLKLDEII